MKTQNKESAGCALDLGTLLACQAGQWFAQRALEVDARSGQLILAGAVLRLCCRADGSQGVKDMQEAVNSLREIAQPGQHPHCCLR